jgi:thiamine pyrophosphate-dependent acetolactate synthase large subunit-like protein
MNQREMTQPERNGVRTNLRNDGTLDRREVVAALLRDPGDLLVVSGLGSATYDLGILGDRDHNFYLWGAMGGAAMIGLGIALAQPARRVLVITGDGEMLMGMGSLATIAAVRTPNLAIAVLDNARYGETGSQHSHTGLTADLAAIAAACGWNPTVTARDMAAVEALRPRLRGEPIFAVVRISPEEKPRFVPPRDGAFVTERFRRALGIIEP